MLKYASWLEIGRFMHGWPVSRVHDDIIAVRVNHGGNDDYVIMHSCLC